MSILLIIVGLINATYLSYLHLNASASCGIGDSCQYVLSSIFSTWFGVPVAVVGVSVYLVLLLIQWLNHNGTLSAHQTNALHLLIITPATAVGLLFIGIQALYLKSFCPFCTLNSIILLGLFIMVYRAYLHNKQVSFSVPTTIWLLLSTLFLLPILTFINPYPAPITGTIGEISGEPVTMRQLEKSPLQGDWNELNTRVYGLKKQFFNTTLLDLHAKKSNQSTNEYIKTTVLPTIDISDQEIQDFYTKRRKDIPADKTFDDVRASIKNYLIREKAQSAIAKHIESLYPQYQAKLMIRRQSSVRIPPNPIQTFAIGQPSAPVHIVEFSDLECGHCKRAYVAMKDIIRTMGEDIYFEYRHFPLPNHSFAMLFSKASVCAGEQNQFFEYIDLVFANQDQLSTIKPDEFARTLSLDESSFSTCMAGRNAQFVVEHDVTIGKQLEVQSTPTFFINGHVFVGIPTAKDILSFL